MTKQYHGKNPFAALKPATPEEVLVLTETEPRHINFILKIIETHCHTAFPVQLDPARGLLGLFTTRDQLDLLLEVLKNIPRPLKIIKIIAEQNKIRESKGQSP